MQAYAVISTNDKTLSSLQAISKHFKTVRVSEKKTVPLFISMVKSHKSKLDQPKPMENS